MSLIISTILATSMSTGGTPLPENAPIHMNNTMSTSEMVVSANATMKHSVPTDDDRLTVVKPSAFPLYIDAHGVPDTELVVTIKSTHDMQLFVDELLTTLPTKVRVTSKYFGSKTLQNMYETSRHLKVEDLTPTLHGLANYSVKPGLRGFTLTDTSHDTYNAASIKLAVDAYVTDVVASLKA